MNHWYFLYCFCVLATCFLSGKGHFRGPHHPRSQVSETHGDHSHYIPHQSDGSPIKLTEDKQLLQDKEHLMEDGAEWLYKDGNEPTEAELEFHYFKMHDFDNNSKLDGLEILQAISHILPMTDVPESNKGEEIAEAHSFLEGKKRAEMIKQREEDFNYYIDLIDKVLQEDDIDHDGYLSYIEYVVGRRKEEKEMKLTKHVGVGGDVLKSAL